MTRAGAGGVVGGGGEPVAGGGAAPPGPPRQRLLQQVCQAGARGQVGAGQLTCVGLQLPCTEIVTREQQ